MKKIYYITGCVVLLLISAYVAKSRLLGTSNKGMPFQVQQGLSDASIQSDEPEKHGEDQSLNLQSAVRENGSPVLKTGTSNNEMALIIHQKNLSEETGSADIRDDQVAEDGHIRSEENEQRSDQRERYVSRESELPDSNNSPQIQVGGHIQNGQVVNRPQQVGFQDDLPAQQQRTNSLPEQQITAARGLPLQKQIADPLLEQQVLSTSDSAVQPQTSSSPPNQQINPNSGSSLLASTGDQVNSSPSGDQIIRPRAGISWKELVMRQREIKKRAFASRTALMLQVAEENQYINQNGIQDEILRVMQ